MGRLVRCVKVSPQFRESEPELPVQQCCQAGPTQEDRVSGVALVNGWLPYCRSGLLIKGALCPFPLSWRHMLCCPSAFCHGMTQQGGLQQMGLLCWAPHAPEP